MESTNTLLGFLLDVRFSVWMIQGESCAVRLQCFIISFFVASIRTSECNKLVNLPVVPLVLVFSRLEIRQVHCIVRHRILLIRRIVQLR